MTVELSCPGYEHYPSVYKFQGHPAQSQHVGSYAVIILVRVQENHRIIGIVLHRSKWRLES